MLAATIDSTGVLSMIRSLAAAALALGLASTGAAAPLAPAARAEIISLMQRLQASGCQFNRNGSWYSGAEAQAHLQQKLDYLERRELVHGTEEFIAKGASESSMSGKPYLVRCGSAAPVESKAWLNSELLALRARGGASSPK
jgi:hypothetical protein